MAYDKVMIDNDGEEYPYSESITDAGYHYRISVVFDDKDGELSIIGDGVDLHFDDGTWLDFNVAPNILFPNKASLTEDDMKNLMGFLGSDQVKERRKLYSKEQVQQIHAGFEEHLKSNNIEQASSSNGGNAPV
jgi:hypothetical protein